MIDYLRRLVVRNLCSPYGLAVVPYLIFLVAWVFPPDIYSYYIHEQDLMYLNPAVLAYFTACVAAFLLGVRIVDHFSPVASVTSTPKIQLRSGSQLLYLCTPMVLAAIPCFVFMMLIASAMNFVALIMTQQGDVMKQANNGSSSTALWGSGLFLLTGALWWAGFRASQLRLTGVKRRVFRLVFAACLGVDILTCLATFDRTNLMPLLAGCTVVYLFFATRGKVKLARLATLSFGSAFAIFVAFVGLQFARGASRLDAFITSILGYTLVSYNRMAAMVLGVMHYQYEGKGAYVIAFLLQNDRLSPIRDRMGLPTAYEVWASEFPSLSASGLNPYFNWLGVFGYLFSDLGWWTPLYMLAAGLIAGYLWSRFRMGKTFALVCYPWMAFWILFWFGWNLLLDARGIVLIEAGILFMVYDRIFLRRVRESSQAGIVPRQQWDAVGPVATTRFGGPF
jgi:hypothetical protein